MQDLKSYKTRKINNESEYWNRKKVGMTEFTMESRMMGDYHVRFGGQRNL